MSIPLSDLPATTNIGATDILHVRDVSGNDFKITGTNFFKQDALAAEFLTLKLSDDSGSILDIDYTNNSSGNRGIINLNTTSGEDIGIRFQSNGTNIWSLYFDEDGSDTLRFRDIVNALDVMTFDTGTGHINMGHGLDTPAFRLVLYSNDSTGVHIQFANSTTGATSSDGFTIGLGSDEIAQIRHRGNKDIRFLTNDTERMRLLASGFLGIGIDSPNNLVHLKDTTPGIEFQDQAGGSNFTIDLNNGTFRINDNASNIFKVDAGASSNALRVDSSSNVWIGNGISFDAGVTNLKVKIIEIGTWNMTGTASKSKAHGLTVGDIREVRVTVQSDSESFKLPLNYGSNDGFWDVSSSDVDVYRVASGFFDGNAAYNGTVVNRGWIFIWYEV